MPPTRAAQTNKIQVLRAESFALPWLRHGFSTRTGGVSDCYGSHSLNLGVTKEDTRENVERNREIFFREIGVTEPTLAKAARVGHPEPTLAKAARVGHASTEHPKVWPAVAMKQIHSGIIHRIEELPKSPLAGDGLITRTPRIVLTVRTADCVPVLLVDPVERAVGAFHAGWRGTLARIVEKGVGEMRRAYGSQPENLGAAIGPAIGRCCYEVSEELKEKFASQFAYADELFEEVFSSEPVREKYPLLFMNMRAPGHGEPPSTVHLDLIEANRRQLLDAGVAEANIWISGLCTSCRNDLLFSHRKEKGRTGRMVAAIAITV
jgi:YfiH family protein